MSIAKMSNIMQSFKTAVPSDLAISLLGVQPEDKFIDTCRFMDTYVHLGVEYNYTYEHT